MLAWSHSGVHPRQHPKCAYGCTPQEHGVGVNSSGRLSQDVHVHIGLQQRPIFQHEGPLYQVVLGEGIVVTVPEALQVQDIPLDSQDKRAT